MDGLLHQLQREVWAVSSCRTMIFVLSFCHTVNCTVKCKTDNNLTQRLETRALGRDVVEVLCRRLPRFTAIRERDKVPITISPHYDRRHIEIDIEGYTKYFTPITCPDLTTQIEIIKDNESVDGIIVFFTNLFQDANVFSGNMAWFQDTIRIAIWSLDKDRYPRSSVRWTETTKILSFSHMETDEYFNCGFVTLRRGFILSSRILTTLYPTRVGIRSTDCSTTRKFIPIVLFVWLYWSIKRSRSKKIGTSILTNRT